MPGLDPGIGLKLGPDPRDKPGDDDLMDRINLVCRRARLHSPSRARVESLMVSTVAVEKREPLPKAAAPSRTAWIDMARGLAEVSVVTFHILQAMNNAGLTPEGLF